MRTGRPLGRPRMCPDDVLALVVDRRSNGALLREIAEELNAAGRETPGGKPVWLPIHVSRLLRTTGAERLRHGDCQPDCPHVSFGRDCGGRTCR